LDFGILSAQWFGIRAWVIIKGPGDHRSWSFPDETVMDVTNEDKTKPARD
jgi:hypothetical protein